MAKAIFEVEPSGESGGFCDCCGNQTRTVWGFVWKEGEPIASYFLHWTVGKSIEGHPANFDLIYGRWGEGTQKADRLAISLVHFTNDGVPGVSVINAADRPVAHSELVGSALSRDNVIDTFLAEEAFGIFDAVITQDHRLK